ncbi:retrovirus-related pol polyprotein from transposon TNT 1-94 [Tanacetum coccineum]
MDVKPAFLNGNLEEEVYVEQPEGFFINGKEKMVCKLKKSIYGLKQASRQWYIKFNDTITSFSFEEIIVDRYMGEASYVIGISIFRDRSQGLLGLSQKAYIDKILERFNMSKCSDGIVPIQKGDKFSLKQCPKNDVERKEMENIPYASVVGSLMYLQTCTRPDISFAIGMLSRYQSNPGIHHWKTAKKVLRYLQGTKDTFLLIKGLITWKWLDMLILIMLGLGVVNTISKPLKMYCDNTATVFFSKNDKYSKGAKHMDIKFFIVKEEIQKQRVYLEHISTDLMTADPLTKGLPPKAFTQHVPRLGLGCIDN